MFNIVDRYVLRQVAKPLVAAMGIGLAMLLAERLVRLLDSTLGKKNSFSMVFELLAYLVPHYLGIAVPAALFLGLLFGFNRLSRDSEVDALMSVGAGLSRLTRPVMILSLILGLFSLLVVGWLQPVTRYAYRSVMFDVGNVEVFYLAQEGVFMQAGNRTFILDQLNRQEQSFQRVFLFDELGTNGLETLTATKGQLVMVPGQQRPVLRLSDGNRLRIDKPVATEGAAQLPTANVASFDVVEAPLGRLSSRVFRPRGDDERELTLPELYSLQKTPPSGATPQSMQAELHKRVVNIVTLLMLPLLAVPFAVGRARSQRGYRFGVALVLVVALHEVIEQGAIATKASGISPWLSMWLPFAAVTLFAIWRFHTAAFTLHYDRLDAALERLSAIIGKLFLPLTRNFRREEPT